MKNTKKEEKISFAVIGYRDHPRRLSTKHKKLKELTFSKRKTLEKSEDEVGKELFTKDNYLNLLE